MLGRMRNLNILKNSQPKLAICITMFNENEIQFMKTMQGIMENYVSMQNDKDI